LNGIKGLIGPFPTDERLSVQQTEGRAQRIARVEPAGDSLVKQALDAQAPSAALLSW
jgi:hypothetical protein